MRGNWTCRWIAAATLLPAVACASSPPGGAPTLVAGALLIDGSGGPARRVDLRIDGERIGAIGALQPHPDEVVIDGGGLVLAPGFIDSHSHHDEDLIERTPDALAAVSQGVTTIIAGQDGGHQHPLADFFARFEASPAAINVASFAGHGTIRRMVMGRDYKRAATDAEVAGMQGLLHAEMAAGALGLSTGLEYDPGSFSTPEEVVALARVAAEHGGRYISHFRSEDQYFWEALEEIIDIGRQTGMPVQVSHIKLAMPRWWGQAARLTARLDEARAAGVRITADIYPYAAWQTGFRWLLTVFPDRDPQRREGAEYVLQEMMRPEGVLLANYPARPEYNGMTVARIAEERGEDPVSTLMSLLAEDVRFAEQGGEAAESSMLGFAMDEPDIEAIMAWPHAVICSDGELAGAHPRGFGTFTRFLGHYVRERRVMSLEEGVHRITALPARHMGILERGTIEVGAYADLVLFDPDTVVDRSTVLEPHRVSSGVRAVWVNGQLVYRDGETTGARPGMAIRRSSATVE